MKPLAVDPREDEGISFLDHLDELRVRLFYSIAALCVAAVVGWVVAPWPLEWLTYPLERAFGTSSVEMPVVELEVGAEGELRLRDRGALALLDDGAELRFVSKEDGAVLATWRGRDRATLHYLRPMDSFVIQLKAALVIGLVLAMPVLIYQLWAFISPGLLAGERRFAVPVVVSGSLLFPTGAIFAYLMLEVTLRFFAQFFMDAAVPFYDARAYLGFALMMMLAFGGLFQFPLLVVIATRAGLVSADWLAERRRHVFVVLLIVAALITPSGDPVTLLALTCPLYFLFEGALVVSRWMDRLAAAESARLDEEDREATPH